MNRIHRIIWSKIREKWIVVSEKSGSSGCPIITVGALSFAALLASFGTAFGIDAGGLPTGGQITTGSGTIASNGSQMTVTQNSAKMIANWNTFNIGQSASVRFDQPTVNSTVLNRIHDQNPSQILGSLTSNGTVFLLNQSGIIFGKNAKVDVGGLVASTLNLSDNDYLNSRYPFSNTGNAGKIENQGKITAIQGGVVALIAPKVTNNGSITADKGSVALLAGDQVTVDFIGDGLIKYAVDKGSVDALAENKALIRADGGLVVMSAEAADALSTAVVSNSGEVRARTLENKGGRILLVSDMAHGTTVVDGRIDATAPDGGNGGFVETSGAKATIGVSAVVDTRSALGATGNWLIDPNDYTIAASGGDATGTDVGSWLSGSNITISTSTMGHSGGNGDIFVNDSITWSSNTLTLNAERNITINSALNGSNTAGLSLHYGQGDLATGNTATYAINAPVNLASTGSFSTKLGSDGPTRNYTIIGTLTELQGMNASLDSNFVLGSNIDATPTSTWNPNGAGGYCGFNPVGDASTQFTGIFDGLGHTITGLTINRSTNYVGLFGYTGSTATINNVGLVDESISGVSSTFIMAGGLVGDNLGTINNCYSTGSVTGYGTFDGSMISVGGLVGYSNGGSITDCHSTSSVTGSTMSSTKNATLHSSVGGLVGYNDVTISNSYSSGNVSGICTGSISSVSHISVGGLAGTNWISGIITNSYYSTSSVTGAGLNSCIGGLAGENLGSISKSNSSGNVGVFGGIGSLRVGGLVGRNSGTITECYSMASVSGGWDSTIVGGLVGSNESGTIDNSYSTGSVNGNGQAIIVGGLVAQNITGLIRTS